MSASLVGSEMCIRDSPNPGGWRRCRRGAQARIVDGDSHGEIATAPLQPESAPRLPLASIS
eukprot:14781162-Alexandrium_andersonii.AAC.1